MRYRYAILTMLLALCSGAGEFIPRGVIANSGVAAETLLHDSTPGFVSGLAWGPEKNFWMFQSQLKLVKLQKGRLAAAYVVVGINETETAPVRMATVGKHIVAMFRTNKKIKYISHDAEGGSAMKTVKLPADFDWNKPVGMADEGIDDKLILASGKAIIAVEVTTGKSKKLFECRDEVLEQGLDVNSKGIIYVSTQNRTYSYYADANELRSGPSLGAPISATENLVFGFGEGIAKFNDCNLSEAKAFKGVRSAELGQIVQLVQLDAKTIAVTGSLSKIYIGKIRGDEVTWNLRYGGISALGVGLNIEGHIFATIASQKPHSGGIVAWNWRQKPTGSPALSEVINTSLPFRQIISDETGTTWGLLDNQAKTANSVTLWQFGLDTGKVRYNTLGGERPPKPSAMCRLDNKLLMLSEDNLDIFSTRAPKTAGTVLQVKRMSWAGANPLTGPRSLAAWNQKRFLVADGNKIILIQETVGGCTSLWDFDTWGDNDDKFGDELYISTSGDYIFVSDTKNHRVLAFSLTKRELQAQIGKKGEAGSRALLNSPTAIAASGPRIVVYDSGNNRILKFKFKP